MSESLPTSKSESLRRWKCVRYCPCEGPRSKAGHFERSKDGPWVLAEDYETLKRQVEGIALTAEADRHAARDIGREAERLRAGLEYIREHAGPRWSVFAEKTLTHEAAP